MDAWDMVSSFANSSQAVAGSIKAVIRQRTSSIALVGRRVLFMLCATGYTQNREYINRILMA